jgi:hypothetical protein
MPWLNGASLPVEYQVYLENTIFPTLFFKKPPLQKWHKIRIGNKKNRWEILRLPTA